MPSRQSLMRLVSENAPDQAGAILAPLLEMLSLARATFAGDVDKFLIMLVVAIRAAGHRDFAQAVKAPPRPGGPTALPSLGVNIQSVADSIGAPKETIRRKVSDLVELGWIERRANDLFLTPRAYEALTPLREAMHMLAVRHFEVVGTLVDGAGPNPA